METKQSEEWVLPLDALNKIKKRSVYEKLITSASPTQMESLGTFISSLTFIDLRLAKELTLSFARWTLLRYVNEVDSKDLQQCISQISVDQWASFLKILTAEYSFFPEDLIKAPPFSDLLTDFLLSPTKNSFAHSPLLSSLRKCLLRIFQEGGSEFASTFFTKHILAHVEHKIKPSKIIESNHPACNVSPVMKEITVENAKKLFVFFDLKTDIGDDAFFEITIEKEGKHQVMRIHTFHHLWKPFLVEGNSFFFCARSIGSDRWGFKMYVCGLGKNQLGEDVLSAPSFDWAWWTIETLLNSSLDSLVFSQDTFSKLVSYASLPLVPFKLPIFRWLSYLLQHSQRFSGSLELAPLKSLFDLMTSLYTEKHWYHEYFQSLVEVVVEVSKKLKMENKPFPWEFTKFPEGVFTQLVDVSLVVDTLVSNSPLPSFFLEECIVQLFVTPVVRETPHPYGKMHQKELLEFPGSQAIHITFDKQCNTQDLLRFSSTESSEGDLGERSEQVLAVITYNRNLRIFASQLTNSFTTLSWRRLIGIMGTLIVKIVASKSLVFDYVVWFAQTISVCLVNSFMIQLISWLVFVLLSLMKLTLMKQNELKI